MAGAGSFTEVFESEADAVNERRRRVALGELDDARQGCPWPRRRQRPDISIQPPRRPDFPPNELGERARPAQGHDLFAIALSGGGVRSASVCLGALQGIDAACPECERQVLDEVDYLSTVSGGGYVGIGLVSALMQSFGRFPFVSKLDQGETLETKQLRDYSNYLMPRGVLDLFIGALAVIRGLMVNAFVLLGPILLAAAATVAINPYRGALEKPVRAPQLPEGLKDNVFGWTIVFGLSLGAVVLLLQIALPWLRRWRRLRPSLTWRQGGNWLHLGLTVLWLVVLFFESQAYVLSWMFEAGARSANDGGTHLAALLKDGWLALVTAATGLVASVSKLTSVVKATAGDRSWSGSFARWGSKAAIYLAAAIAPLLLWVVYLAFSYWGIADVSGQPIPYTPGLYRQTPDWLLEMAIGRGVSFQALYATMGLIIVVLSCLVRTNAGSLHSYYRDRLSRAFLWNAAKLQKANLGHKGVKTSNVADRRGFSTLKPHGQAEMAYAPYLLVNTAVNLGGSAELNRRGRNADSFIFSPSFVGSAATGYIRSSDLEDRDPNAGLATAMAASGAAASANMGASTIKALTFTLSALNVRLGYWISNPKAIDGTVKGWDRWLPDIAYFFREALGWINEKDRYVYLTDGGHYDNLGLYELLKRRCRVILAVDAEADPLLHFDSLIRLQRYARIDLGVRIELPWPKLKEHALKVTADCPTGSPASWFPRNGPHVAIGRVQYSDDADDIGILIYAKASLSGDESDLLRDYKRRNADFPHETTVDQFFSEEQFEVYRALGFHMTKHFLSGHDRAVTIDPDDDPDWKAKIEEALLRMGLPAACAAKIRAGLVT